MGKQGGREGRREGGREGGEERRLEKLRANKRYIWRVFCFENGKQK